MHIAQIAKFEPTPLMFRLVTEALANGRLSYGPMHREFEARFAKMHGKAHGIFTASGTCALQLALQSLKEIRGWGDGDEVIVPAVTFPATVNVVIHCGLKPVFADVCRDTYNIDPAQIEARVTDRTRCIIPVHLLGLPADMDAIMAIADRHNLDVIEDSCEAVMVGKNINQDGEWRVGQRGVISCFSTYVAHHLVTGVGGFALTSDAEIATKIRSLMNHGRDPIYLSIDDATGSDIGELKEIVERRFRFVSIGHSFRCTELEAALGLAQIDGLGDVVRKRIRNAATLKDKLAKHGRPALGSGFCGMEYQHVPDATVHSYLFFGFTVDHGRDDLVFHLEKNGVETRDLFPLVNQPIYRELVGNPEESFPVAWELHKKGLIVGCHDKMSDAELELVAVEICGGIKAHGA